MINHKILNKGEVDMISKYGYIKRVLSYIVVTAVLAVNLSSVAFGLPLGKNKAGLGQSLGRSEVVLGQSIGESEDIKVLEKNSEGYYKIGSRAALKEFARKVNSGKEPNAKGKLMNDIEFNGGSVIENVKLEVGSSAASKVKENRKLKEGNFEEWTPIGTQEHPFIGELIGNNKTIIGLYIDKENNRRQGLFGVIGKGGKVSNIKISGSYIKGNCDVGGIAGENRGEIEICSTDNSVIIAIYGSGGNVGYNKGIMKGKCNNSGTVIGNGHQGGNVGENDGKILGECNNSGEVIVKYYKGGEEYVGGNVGFNDRGTISGRCNNAGKVTGKAYYVGGNVGENNGTILGECNNSGEIEGKESVGGNIGGIFNGEIKECNNSGNVKGEENVGGNIGLNCKESLKVVGKNEGDVTGVDYVGGNVGRTEKKIYIELINTGEVAGETHVDNNVGNYV